MQGARRQRRYRGAQRRAAIVSRCEILRPGGFTGSGSGGPGCGPGPGVPSETFCVSSGEALAVNLSLPPYPAVIVCVPAARSEVTSVATPSCSVPVPSVEEPSLNVTSPVGWPSPEGTVTVAVKVTNCPLSDAASDDSTEVDE